MGLESDIHVYDVSMIGKQLSMAFYLRVHTRLEILYQIVFLRYPPSHFSCDVGLHDPLCSPDRSYEWAVPLSRLIGGDGSNVDVANIAGDEFGDDLGRVTGIFDSVNCLTSGD